MYMNKKQSISELLDDQCSSTDLDSLLCDNEATETWYRYHTVSAIIKDEYSAHCHQSFYTQVSGKIADEPAIVASPKKDKVASLKPGELVHFKRATGGLAIAASAAFATFISVQSLQVADQDNPQSSSLVAESAVETLPNIKINEKANIQNSLEQTELDIFNLLYVREANASGRSEYTPVGSEVVKTYRFSAEQWQQIVREAALRQKALEEQKRNKDESQ